MINMKKTHVTNITIGKISDKKILSGVTRHNERNYKQGQYPAHIDERRAMLNETIIGTEHMNLYNAIVNRIMDKRYEISVTDRMTKDTLRYADGSKVRKDAVLAFESVMQYPGDLIWCRMNDAGEPERIPWLEEINDITVNDIRANEHQENGFFLYPKDMDEYTEWINASVDFMNEKFGKRNIIQVHSHMDESVPHIHVIGVPFYRDDNDIEKLAFKKYEVDGRKALAKLQTDYAEALKYLGYVRGDEFSTRVSYSTHYEFRARESAAIDAELSENPVEAKEMYKDAIVQCEALKMELEMVHATEKVVSKLRKKEQELNEELKKKILENEILQNRVKQLEHEAWRRECEIKGMHLHPKPDIINDVYLVMQEQLVNLGEKYYDSVGVRSISHDNREQEVNRGYNGIGRE